jgi:hypothetical protein
MTERLAVALGPGSFTVEDRPGVAQDILVALTGYRDTFSDILAAAQQ